MKDYADQSDVFSFDVAASDIKNIPMENHRNKTSSCSDFDSIDDELTGNETGTKKSSRACKGKRYMEFMNAQRVNPITKRFKPRTTSTSSSASLSPTQPPRSFVKKSSNAAQKMDFDAFDHLYANSNVIQSMPIASPKPIVDIERIPSIEHTAHRSDVGDFELDHRINALPALNLDEYLTRKQTTKKKKKSHEKRTTNGHRKIHKITKTKSKLHSLAPSPPPQSASAPKTIQEAKECLVMVGSKKRKARKESITRRDVQQVTAIVQSFVPHSPSNSFTINLSDNNAARCSASGLLMLATMAEVAANYAA